ncbi:hypothetical protein Ancab_009772 [Ancistrocladus abbreviatus]
MASRYEVEVTMTSAKDLKNVNWRRGPLKPYAVVWVDPARKCSTRIDEEGDTSPYWNQTLRLPLYAPIEDSALYIDIVHANAAEDTKPLIGSARIPLRDVVDDAGIGGRATRNLQLKRPSGRPQGKLNIEVSVRDTRYAAPDAYRSPGYGVRDYGAPPPVYATPYSAPTPPAYAATPPAGYPYNAPPTYNAPPAYAQGGYGQGAYGYGQASYGQQPVVVEEKKKSKFGGMGTGLAVGAVAGALGGLALAEGFNALEDHVADEAAERVEDDLAARDDFGGDDFADDGGW